MESPFKLNQVTNPEHRVILSLLTTSTLTPSELSQRINISRPKLYRIAEKYFGPQFMTARDQTIKYGNLQAAIQSGIHISEDVIKIDALKSEVENNEITDGTAPELNQTPALVDKSPNAPVNKEHKRHRGNVKEDLCKLEEIMRDLFFKGEYPKINSCFSHKLCTFCRSKIVKLRLKIFNKARVKELPESTSPYFPGISFNEFITSYALKKSHYLHLMSTSSVDAIDVNEPQFKKPLPPSFKAQTDKPENLPPLPEVTIKVRGIELNVHVAPEVMGDCVAKILDKLKDF